MGRVTDEEAKKLVYTKIKDKKGQTKINCEKCAHLHESKPDYHFQFDRHGPLMCWKCNRKFDLDYFD